MQPPTWLLTGLAGVLIGVAGLGIGYELRDDGGTAAVTAETTQPAALPTSCALFTRTNERLNGDPENKTSLDLKEQFLDLWAKACR